MSACGTSHRPSGVTDFPAEPLQELIAAGVPIVSNQVQYSLIDRRPENGLLDYCVEAGIKVQTAPQSSAGRSMLWVNSLTEMCTFL